MAQPNQPSEQVGFDPDTEYRAIEAALLETPRGRWFLSEHGRRARRLDSAVLEEAVERLTNTLRQPPAMLGALQREVEALQASLSDARQNLLAKPAQATAGSDAVTSTPQGILKAAEDLHEMAWALQANDVNPEGCETIARNASKIYALSHAQAAEGARARQFSETLEAAATRLSALLEIIGHEMQTDVGSEAA